MKARWTSIKQQLYSDNVNLKLIPHLSPYVTSIAVYLSIYTGAVDRKSTFILPFPIYARNDSSLCGTLPGPQPSCQSDSACDYDLWSTGNASLAQRTLQFSQRYQELQSELRPGIIIYVNTGVFIMIGAWVKDNAFFNLMYCRGNSNWRPTFFFECTVFIFSFSQIQQSDTHHIDKNNRYYMYARIWSLVYSCIIPIRLAVSSNFLDNTLNKKCIFLWPRRLLY